MNIFSSTSFQEPICWAAQQTADMDTHERKLLKSPCLLIFCNIINLLKVNGGVTAHINTGKGARGCACCGGCSVSWESESAGCFEDKETSRQTASRGKWQQHGPARHPRVHIQLNIISGNRGLFRDFEPPRRRSLSKCLLSVRAPPDKCEPMAAPAARLSARAHGARERDVSFPLG